MGDQEDVRCGVAGTTDKLLLYLVAQQVLQESTPLH